jgi:ATP-dependent Clp protease ATP-binding subunit ClpA
MFERFTSQARSAVVQAQEEARRIRHPRVGTGHLLLGVLAVETGTASRVLAGLRLGLDDGRESLARLSSTAHRFAPDEAEALRAVGIDLDEVRRSLEDAFGPGVLDRSDTRGRPRRHIPFTPRAKRALEDSLREALRLGSRSIGSEHILLGLLRDTGSTATMMLCERGITAEQVREAADREVGEGGDRPGRTA